MRRGYRLTLVCLAGLCAGSFGFQHASVAGAAPGPLKPVTQIVSGDTHSCALLSNGTVRCWGDRQYGQLGSNGGSQKCANAHPCSTVPARERRADR